MNQEKKPAVSDVGAWAMNVVSSVGIIMVNKELMSPNGYTFCFGNSIQSISLYLYISSQEWFTRTKPLCFFLFKIITATTLTGFHFAVTALVGWISNATGYSMSKHVPLWELLWFSIVANASITSMNLSLMLNSVGFYQVFYLFYLQFIDICLTGIYSTSASLFTFLF